MVPAALVTASDAIGSVRVAAVAVLLGESDEVVARQRQELLETTTPVIRLWEGIVIVALGIDLGDITTRATLSDALKYGLTQTGVRLGTGG